MLVAVTCPLVEIEIFMVTLPRMSELSIFARWWQRCTSVACSPKTAWARALSIVGAATAGCAGAAAGAAATGCAGAGAGFAGAGCGLTATGAGGGGGGGVSTGGGGGATTGSGDFTAAGAGVGSVAGALALGAPFRDAAALELGLGAAMATFDRDGVRCVACLPPTLSAIGVAPGATGSASRSPSATSASSVVASMMPRPCGRSTESFIG